MIYGRVFINQLRHSVVNSVFSKLVFHVGNYKRMFIHRVVWCVSNSGRDIGPELN